MPMWNQQYSFPYPFTASLSITLERLSRPDIDCSGAIIPYNCSIQSNTVALQLTWRVTLPGQMPISITYSNITNDRAVLTSHITTSVTRFQGDEYIDSTLKVTVYPGLPTDQILLECSTDGFGTEAINVLISTSGKHLLKSMGAVGVQTFCSAPKYANW